MSTMPTDPQAGGWGPVTPLMVEHLRRTKGWVRFLAVMLFLVSGLLVLVSLLLLALGSSMFGAAAPPGMNPAIFGGILAAVYVLSAAFSLVFAFLLNRYASSIARLLAAPDVPTVTATMERALWAQRSIWRAYGAMTLVVVCLYAGIFVIAVILGIVGALAGAK